VICVERERVVKALEMLTIKTLLKSYSEFSRNKRYLR